MKDYRIPRCHVIDYRPFQNTDLPAIVDLWREQPQFRRLSSTVSRNDLDHLVLSKPYFDPEGFIIARQAGETVGFVHAGFGPNASGSDLDFKTGLLCQLRCRPGPDSNEVRDGLVTQALQYLRAKGAELCYSASKFPFVPFYLGLYGGSRIPGVPQEDEWLLQALRSHGFLENEKIPIYQRTLAGFRTPIDRQLMKVRRQFQLVSLVDPLPATWWENCMLGWAETFSFRIHERETQQPVGGVNFWEIQPLSIEWGVRSVGMFDVHIDANLHQQGLGTFLVGQALTQLMQQGVGLCEVQVRSSNHQSIRLFEKLGFEQVSEGLEMVKPL